MTADIRLTQYARARGGAGKLPRGEPAEAMAALLPAVARGGPAIIAC